MPTATSYERAGYRAWVLAVLTASCALNFLDRQLVVILQEPIRAELGLSDTQLGLLSGFGFSGVYVVCGVLVAQWSESRPRRGVIALAILLWSGMTALCGLAQGFAALMLARMGVAVGESGAGPPAHSLIADIFAPRQRGRALAIYAVGINVGILCGYLLGGWLNELYGWRTAFFALGLPGVLLALVVRFGVAEPLRGRFDPPALRAQAAPRLGVALRELASRRSFRWIAIAASCQAFALYGVGAWLPSYLIRSFGLGTAEVGSWLALILGGVGALGTLAGGWFGDRLGERDPRWYLRLPLLGGLVSLPFAVAMFIVRDAYAALALNVIPVFLNFVYMAPVLVAAQLLVGPRMRAMTSAVLFFVINLVGMGGGPLCVGVLSDLLAPQLGANALRAALVLTVLLATVTGALAYLRAVRAMDEDLRRMRAAPATEAA